MKFRPFRLPGAVRAAVNSRIQPWHRYHGFLTIIKLRYDAEAAKYDPRPVSGVRVYHVHEDLLQILQLDVENFYIYTNMLLDQIAENVRFFFDLPRAKKTNLNPHGYWNHLTLLAQLAKGAASLGLAGDVPGLLAQAEEFRKLRAYRNESITHWDASDTHLATAWDGKDLTIQRGFQGDPAELERRIAAKEFEFQMTTPIPTLYVLVDNYAATVQEFLEANAAKFVGK
ncbi:MAG: hypothetical protein ABSB87_19505 [Terriglobales bacterium]|jgi:hypothetical protein